MSTEKKPHNSSTHDIGNEVLARIEREHITPTARTFFVFREGFFWFLWILTVIVGAVAVSILIFTELNVGWEVYEITHKTALTFFVESLPYIWLALLILVTVLGFINMRYTKHGYRHSLLGIVSFGLIGSLFGGLILHAVQIDGVLDRALGFVPLHTPVQHVRAQLWNHPELGLYAGTIEEVDSTNDTMTLKSPDGTKHEFSLSSLPPDLVATLEVSDVVRVIATSTQTNTRLLACHIFSVGEHDIQTVEEIRERKQAFLSGLESRIQRTLGSVPNKPDDACIEVLRARRDFLQPTLPVRQ